jgi:Protein of unknown function (DUF2630)
MADETVTGHIEQLVEEEHKLRAREADDSQHPDQLADDRVRLEQIGVELDRCWDLLRQRRARRSAGEDPDAAQLRDSDTVEHYRQ